MYIIRVGDIMADKKEKFEFDKFRIISTRRLSTTMAEGRKNGERFCFILGSGASFESGIPIGTELEKTWMNDMEKAPGFVEVCRNAAALRAFGKLDYDFEKDILPKWKNGEKLCSEYYFDIYTLRFFPNHRNGYFYFEKLISEANPSFGYNALAQILSDGLGSNLAIKINSDNLLEKTVFSYTEKTPLVFNCDKITYEVFDPNITKPIVINSRRNVFFDPLSVISETSSSMEKWTETLRLIFHIYTPVVIGYDGDRSFMDLLERKDVKMNNGIFWCYLENSGLPDERVLKLISDKNGCLVKTAGFDAVMLSLGNALVPDKIEPQNVSDYLKKQCDDRVGGYEKQYNDLMKKSFRNDEPEPDSYSEFKEEANGLDKRVEETRNLGNAYDYFYAGNRAYEEKDYKKAIVNYCKAIELNPNYAEAYQNRCISFAVIGKLDEAVKDRKKVEKLLAKQFD